MNSATHIAWARIGCGCMPGCGFATEETEATEEDSGGAIEGVAEEALLA
jgi:hypothetical protein